jgi:hypothetical protein
MEYLVEDLASVLKEADSMIINSEAKVGKMTFAFYLVKLLFNEKALIFSPQESYLFNKKLTSLAKQFRQYKDMENYITRYSLNEEWSNLKRVYGYTYLLEELERIIVTSEEKLVLFHRLGEFFEFQDRYEIESFYKSLVKIVTKHGKKIIFIVNNQNQNYKYIQSVAEEFSDVSITLTKNEKNERLVDVKNILTHQEYPPMQFLFYEKNFILKHLDEAEDSESDRAKNILIMELDTNLDSLQANMVNIYQYIFNRPEFHLYHANSFQSILHNIFIKPDVIIILMNRTEENFETIRAIKKQLPKTTIISVVEQDFVRTEDVQKAYDYGCDELFPRTYLFDKFILALQKSIKLPFYSDTLNRLPESKNILESKNELKELATFCIENTIFFSIFAIKKNEKYENLKSTMRRLDYMYVNEDKIYYMALNTMPENIKIILEKQAEKFGEKLDLLSVCTPLNLEMLEECF